MKAEIRVHKNISGVNRKSRCMCFMFRQGLWFVHVGTTLSIKYQRPNNRQVIVILDHYGKE